MKTKKVVTDEVKEFDGSVLTFKQQKDRVCALLQETIDSIKNGEFDKQDDGSDAKEFSLSLALGSSGDNGENGWLKSQVRGYGNGRDVVTLSDNLMQTIQRQFPDDFFKLLLEKRGFGGTIDTEEDGE